LVPFWSGQAALSPRDSNGVNWGCTGQVARLPSLVAVLALAAGVIALVRYDSKAPSHKPRVA